MKFIRKHKLLTLLVGIFLLIVLFYLIRWFIASRDIYYESYLDGEDYNMNPKTYGVNEYSLVNITDEQMINIYINDFKHNLFNNINYAYLLVNEKYRNVKFGNIDNFKNYINQLDLMNTVLKEYSVKKTVQTNIYTAYLENGKMIIFKTNSVMDYEVYFDDYTVEI